MTILECKFARVATSIALLLVVPAMGCSFVARDAEAYRQATRDALVTQNDKIETCYDQALASDTGAAGQVVVHFAVEKKTGKVIHPQLDEQGTTASPVLAQCVLATLDGVALPEPDRREGQATFTWSFAAQPSAEASADAAPAESNRGDQSAAPPPVAPEAPAQVPAGTPAPSAMPPADAAVPPAHDAAKTSVPSSASSPTPTPHPTGPKG